MPTVKVEMFSGRTPQQKRDLVRLVTDAVAESLSVDPAGVRVQIVETERHHSAVGGVLRSDAAGEAVPFGTP
ncbi:hypothetical protein GCM10010399_14310 [Dactylosporangium fulvum]|uniref:Tautomerase family protein n=1 Tax=Dactylosporangium fulvum TaxID=53359 RepID=A0ABY5VSW0_9ACTN|nr:tautomerase family protein [Dactylosporangium fulvum]UWP80285.1 tautomerase family protein [Dactylosporangium fulvum]